MLNEKSVHFFSLLLETLERSGTGAERAKNLVSGSGAVSGCEKIGWSGSGAGAGGRGAGNGAVSGSVRNRFERRAEILPLPLRSHALLWRDRVTQCVTTRAEVLRSKVSCRADSGNTWLFKSRCEVRST